MRLIQLVGAVYLLRLALALARFGACRSWLADTADAGSRVASALADYLLASARTFHRPS